MKLRNRLFFTIECTVLDKYLDELIKLLRIISILAEFSDDFIISFFWIHFWKCHSSAKFLDCFFCHRIYPSTFFDILEPSLCSRHIFRLEFLVDNPALYDRDTTQEFLHARCEFKRISRFIELIYLGCEMTKFKGIILSWLGHRRE